jgi:hypothetical protein
MDQVKVTKHGHHIMSANIWDSSSCRTVIQFIENNMESAVRIEANGYNNNSNSFAIYPGIFSQEDNEEFAEADSIIFKGVSRAIDAFVMKSLPHPEDFSSQDLSDSGYEYRKVMGATAPHFDGPRIETDEDGFRYRVGTLVISLSNIGDDLIFPDLGVTIPLEEGCVVFFPPYWTHRHETKWEGKEGHRVQTWLYSKQT